MCKDCKRPFARQDALARHEKLHTRRDLSQCPSPPASHVSRQSVLSPSSSGPLDVLGSGAATNRALGNSLGEAHGEVQNAQLSTDMDFDLIWPDSEELLENLVSMDSTTQWQAALGTLPIRSAHRMSVMLLLNVQAPSMTRHRLSALFHLEKVTKQFTMSVKW